jgi:site-specific recombinase XerD
VSPAVSAHAGASCRLCIRLRDYNDREERAEVRGYAHHGAHIFRHSLATGLLRSDATLSEIGQLLRHESHDTTRIYVKVDIQRLRTLSLPWTGGV